MIKIIQHCCVYFHVTPPLPPMSLYSPPPHTLLVYILPCPPLPSAGVYCHVLDNLHEFMSSFL